MQPQEEYSSFVAKIDFLGEDGEPHGTSPQFGLMIMGPKSIPVVVLAAPSFRELKKYIDEIASKVEEEAEIALPTLSWKEKCNQAATFVISDQFADMVESLESDSGSDLELDAAKDN